MPWPRDVVRLRSAPTALRIHASEALGRMRHNCSQTRSQPLDAPVRASQAASESEWCARPPLRQGSAQAAGSAGAAAARAAQAATHALPQAVYVTASGAVGLVGALRLPCGVAAVLRSDPALRPATADAAPPADLNCRVWYGETGEEEWEREAWDWEDARAGRQPEGGQHGSVEVVR